MNGKNMKRLLAVVAFCMGVSPVLGKAHAQYTVMLDCHGDNGLPTWAQTSDTLTVKVWVNGHLHITWWNTVNLTCDREDKILINVDNAHARDVTNIRISTSGHNAFWLDKLIVVDATYRHQWGVDNNTGWCFSTTPADGNNSYCSPATGLVSRDFDNPDN